MPNYDADTIGVHGGEPPATPFDYDKDRKHERFVQSKFALPTEMITAGVLILAVVVIGSRVADLVLTVMACGVCYLAGRWHR